MTTSRAKRTGSQSNSQYRGEEEGGATSEGAGGGGSRGARAQGSSSSSPDTARSLGPSGMSVPLGRARDEGAGRFTQSQGYGIQNDGMGLRCRRAGTSVPSPEEGCVPPSPLTVGHFPSPVGPRVLHGRPKVFPSTTFREESTRRSGLGGCGPLSSLGLCCFTHASDPAPLSCPRFPLALWTLNQGPALKGQRCLIPAPSQPQLGP